MDRNKKARQSEPSVADQIIERMRDFTEALKSGEPIEERFTCRTIALDLRPTPHEPKLVKKTRQLLGTSQAVFALLLGVSPNTVRAWEQGVNTPSDIACRFMDEIRRDPEYWCKRLRSAVVVK